MTQTQAREIAAELRCGNGHYVRLNPEDQYAARIYRISRSRAGEIKVYLGMDRGWSNVPAGTAIYSDRESYHA